MKYKKDTKITNVLQEILKKFNRKLKKIWIDKGRRFYNKIRNRNKILYKKKTDFDDKLKNLNKKITSNKTKHLLAENEFKKLPTFDLTQVFLLVKVTLIMAEHDFN